MKIAAALPLLFAVALTAQTVPAAAPQPEEPVGYTDTPMLPGLPWHVHDPNRPHPPIVTPTPTPGGAPSDAIVLFNGHDLSHWHSRNGTEAPAWKLTDDYLEVVPGVGDIATNEKFGDVQLHVEWASPTPPTSNSQGRGNSGIFLMGRYEIQVLDSFSNPTYADGQASAIYGQWPPLVNPIHHPGEWNSYDILFEAPRMNGDKVLRPAYVTVLFNGVLVQNHRAILGPTVHHALAHYVAQPAEDSLVLQNHGHAVRYRNIWIRKLPAQEEPKE